MNGKTLLQKQYSKLKEKKYNFKQYIFDYNYNKEKKNTTEINNSSNAEIILLLQKKSMQFCK